MIPELFRIGSVSISPFGVAMMAAFLAAYFQLRWGLRAREAGDAEDAGALVFWGGFAGILGAKLYYAALYGDWSLLLERWGLVWYGGFIASVLTLLWIIKRRRLPLAATTDALSIALALGYGIGRVGCFLVGDDYGRPTDLPWGIAFAEGLPPTTAGALRDSFGLDLPATIADGELLRVHPTQLYETAAALAIWWLALRLVRAGAVPGRVSLIVLGLLAIERFLVELVRVKDDRFFAGLTLAQLISLAVLAVVIVLWRRLRAGAAPRSTAAP